MAQVLTLNHQAATVNNALAEVRKSVKGFASKTHPAALVAWFIVGLILLCGVVFTGWHNWSLFARGANTDFGQIVAAVPPLMLDGSIVLLLVLLLTYFRDPLQWWVAVGFNALLFIIVGINTSLNYSLTTGEAVTGGMRIYLRWGILGSFLLAFAVWEILIHLDPIHKRNAAKAKLEMQAEDDAHQIELELIQMEIEQRRNDLEYQKTVAGKMHAARMKAAQSADVDQALIDFEKQEAIQRAKVIRGVHPTAGKA